MASSCGDEKAELPQKPAETNDAKPQPVKVNQRSEPAVESFEPYKVDAPDSAIPDEEEVAPAHGSPDPDKLDSVKNSYPKKG